jgi:hypothetical protein
MTEASAAQPEPAQPEPAEPGEAHAPAISSGSPAG